VRKPAAAVAIFAALSLAGCAGLSDTSQRTLTGAGAGAAAGTVVGALTGATLWGAAIGAAGGAATGFIWDQHKQAESRAYQRGVETGRREAQPAAN
jgi:uncharacterized membrane protein